MKYPARKHFEKTNSTAHEKCMLSQTAFSTCRICIYCFISQSHDADRTFLNLVCNLKSESLSMSVFSDSYMLVTQVITMRE